jgi:hypothetical protein
MGGKHPDLNTNVSIADTCPSFPGLRPLMRHSSTLLGRLVFLQGDFSRCLGPRQGRVRGLSW